MGIIFLVTFGFIVSAFAQDGCDVSSEDKVDCGQMGTHQDTCEAVGCCWEPVDPNPSNLPWCYYSTSTTNPPTGSTTTTTPNPNDKCAVSSEDKVDCGELGSSEDTCKAAGCCWQPVEPNPSGLPWCYYSTDYEDPCKDFTWTGDGPGFTDDFYNIMFQK